MSIYIYIYIFSAWSQDMYFKKFELRMLFWDQNFSEFLVTRHAPVYKSGP